MVVAIGIGQDLGNIVDYIRNFPDYPPRAVMSYSSLGKLEGLWNATEYGSGVEFATGALEAAPEAVLQLGLYLDDLEAASSGASDGNATRLAEYLGSLAPRKTLLRIGYEFDSPLNMYAPDLYVRAFRRIAAAMPENVDTVWHSWAFEPWAGRSIEAWWPGDTYVDFIGVSIFQQAYGDSALGNLTYAQDVADFALSKRKPLVVAESTPFGLGVDRPAESIWRDWFEPVLDFVHQNDVQLWCYINCDWDHQPMWRGEGWGDTRVQDDPDLKTRWVDHVLDGHRLDGPGPVLPPRPGLHLFSQSRPAGSMHSSYSPLAFAAPLLCLTALFVRGIVCPPQQLTTAVLDDT